MKLMKRTLLLLTLCASCFALTPVEKEKPIKDKVESLLASMTVEEKVGQMAQITLDVITKGPSEYASDEPLALDPALLKKAIVDYKIGSILNAPNNRARTPQKWHEVITQIQKEAQQTRLKIPVLYGIDAIHGTTYTAGATFFPQQIGQAAMWNRDLVRQAAEICAYETRASAIPWNFSPVLDIGRDPRNPRIWETFGEDVYLASELGKQVIDGYEGPDNNVGSPVHVAATLKHYLGYSAPHAGKDRTPAYIPEIELRERHVPVFKAAIDAGAHSVMVNSALINGKPTHANYGILTKLLKEELGFQGMVVTDWKDIEALHDRDRIAATQKEAVKLAINAGIDMSMIPYNFKFCDYLVELVKEGEVPMARIDDAVRRILTLKYELKLFEVPVTNYKDYPEFGSKQHEQVAYEAAAESITLLKNENNLLPFKKDATILVTGPNANSMRSLNGGWSYSWQGEKVDEFAGQYQTILEAMQQTGGKEHIIYEQGIAYHDAGKYWEEKDVHIPAAVKAAQKADYILLCLGENTYTETPGNLHDLNISQNQVALAKALAETGKPIVLVLNEGRPRLIREIEPLVKSVLHIYLPGNFGGNALADIVYGKVNPSGKLPYTYPRYPNTLLTYDHKPSEEQLINSETDLEKDFIVQYPFGFGLSYTNFSYTDLQVSKASVGASESLKISVTVKNTGSTFGKEVVQLFVSDRYASITPDVKRLRGFEKISLKPGESKQVSFSITPKDLAFVGEDLAWTVEKGDYDVMIGGEKATFAITESKTFNEVKTVL